MNRRNFIQKASVGVAGLSSIPYWKKIQAQTPNAKGKPNILMIVLDSTKASALSMYGNKHCKTPNLDKLAKDGITISHAYCSLPKCVPNRSSMLTGRYIHVDGMRALTGKKYKEEASDAYVITKNIKSSIREMLDNGYELCHKGINHIVGWEIYNEWFRYTTDWELHKTINHIPETETDAELRRARYAGKVPEGFDMEKTYDAVTTKEMTDFIESHSQEAPFFAYLDLRSPHPEYFDYPVFEDYYKNLDVPVPPKAKMKDVAWNEKVYRETYDLEKMVDEKWKKVVRAYYSAISYSDMLIGRVMDSLEKKGISDNTVVIFTSDHGDYAGDHGCTEKHDPLLHDSLTHLPLIIKYPKMLDQNMKKEALVEQIDLAPTILDFCGIGIPSWMHGKSLMPLLTGAKNEHKKMAISQGGVERHVIDKTILDREEILNRMKGKNYYNKQKVILDYPEFMMRAKMLRTKNYKFIYRLNGYHEFYDMVNDPQELVNEFNNKKFTKEIENHQKMLLKFMLETENDMPELEWVSA